MPADFARLNRLLDRTLDDSMPLNFGTLAADGTLQSDGTNIIWNLLATTNLVFQDAASDVITLDSTGNTIDFHRDLDFQQGATIRTTADDLTLTPTGNVIISSGELEVNDAIHWDTDVAVTAARAEITRVAGSLHINVPTGENFSFRVNDVAEMELSATDLDLQNNTISNIGAAGNDFGASQLDLAASYIIRGANGLTVDTTAGNLTLSAAAGADVLIGDDVTILYVDGGTGGIGVGATSHVDFKLWVSGTQTASVDGAMLAIDGTVNVASGRQGYGLFVRNTFVENSAAGNHALLASIYVSIPPVTAGTHTVTRTALLYIAGAMSAGGTANYAIWADGGTNRFDGDVRLGTLIQADTATEVGFCVTNASLTVGSLGSVVIPTSAANASDALAGNVDGAIYLDSTGAAERFYFRHGGAWHYVSQTAGFTWPKEEKETFGHKWEVGDLAIMKVDNIQYDGAVHALPYFFDVERKLGEIENWHATMEDRVTALEEAKAILENKNMELEALIASK